MEIKITEEAQKRLLEVLSSSDYNKPALRLFLAGMGWGGPKFGMALDESKDTKDDLRDVSDIKILIDKNLLNRVDPNTMLTVGFNKSVYGEGFTIDSGDCSSGSCDSKGCC